MDLPKGLILVNPEGDNMVGYVQLVLDVLRQPEPKHVQVWQSNTEFTALAYGLKPTTWYARLLDAGLTVERFAEVVEGDENSSECLIRQVYHLGNGGSLRITQDGLKQIWAFDKQIHDGATYLFDLIPDGQALDLLVSIGIITTPFQPKGTGNLHHQNVVNYPLIRSWHQTTLERGFTFVTSLKSIIPLPEPWLDGLDDNPIGRLPKEARDVCSEIWSWEGGAWRREKISA